MLLKSYQQIIKDLTPFVISFGPNTKQFNFDFWGYSRDDFHIMDPLNRSTHEFWHLVKAIDGISFGAQGMGMENWVMFDCGAMPSAIVGFCMEKSMLSSNFKKIMGVNPNYDGPIPVSFYIAIPGVIKGEWFGHNLSSLNANLPQKYPGLGLMTKALAIKLCNIGVMYGATQWGNPALHVHCQLAPMEILSSYTPVHTHPNSLCYKSVYPVADLERYSLSGKKRISHDHDFLLHVDDFEALISIQDRIEAGERFIMNGRPVQEHSKLAYPIKVIE